ncbi:MAG: cyclic nucleotide-binding domain-containing protein [Anaerolineae bacterium]|nr:cyclic nucleotide-binding domain-containing protein [Anaerolineae bacterium]MDW8071535.1 cyclic nucleotide-binding domain-containing protein [Anaerolineae bacterium]
MVTVDLLARWPFFAGLDARVLDALAALANLQHFSEGATIFRQGTPATHLYLLLEGWVDLTIDADVRSVRRELLMTLTQGEVFGWSAVVEPYVYTAAAQCATPVVVLAFSGADLLALFATDARLCYTLMNRICRVIARRLETTRAQLVGLFWAR